MFVFVVDYLHDIDWFGYIFQNLCETHPVVFEKLLQDDAFWDYKPKVKIPVPGTLNPDGYKVNIRSKKRLGLDGQESASVITTLSIDQSHSQYSDIDDSIHDQMSIEDVVDSRLPYKYKDDNKPLSQAEAAITLTNGHKMASPASEAPSNVFERDSVRSSSRNGSALVTEPRASIPSKSPQGNYTLQTEAEWPNLMVTNSKSSPPVKNSGSSSRAGSRAASAKRPSTKLSLHKAASSGASISAHSNQGDTAYIQISQGLQPNKDSLHTNKNMTPRSMTPIGAMIKSVHDSNKYDYGEGREGDSQLGELTGRSVGSSIPKVYTTLAPANTPPSSGSPTPPPDVKIAFNIPTADLLDQSDMESYLDSNEHKHLINNQSNSTSRANSRMGGGEPGNQSNSTSRANSRMGGGEPGNQSRPNSRMDGGETGNQSRASSRMDGGEPEMSSSATSGKEILHNGMSQESEATVKHVLQMDTQVISESKEVEELREELQSGLKAS